MRILNPARAATAAVAIIDRRRTEDDFVLRGVLVAPRNFFTRGEIVAVALAKTIQRKDAKRQRRKAEIKREYSTRHTKQSRVFCLLRSLPPLRLCVKNLLHEHCFRMRQFSFSCESRIDFLSRPGNRSHSHAHHSKISFLIHVIARCWCTRGLPIRHTSNLKTFCSRRFARL